MGTRNLIEVKANGEIKVAQYGQWDGYPTGQGSVIADFLRGVDCESFIGKLKRCTFMSEEDIKAFNSDESKKIQDHPWLSRDAGAKVLSMIDNSDGLSLVDSSSFKEDKLFCEFHYLIDMDLNTVSVNNSKPYKFNEWTNELMDRMESEEEIDL